MTLRELVGRLDPLEVRGVLDATVSGLALDSRRVRAGDVFFALQGVRADGARFAAAAQAAGALALVGPPGLDVPGATVIEVAEPRLALAQAACAFHGEPSRALDVVAVTGTNGKTTVTYLLEAILVAAGRRAGVIGTTGARIDGVLRPLAFTTPEAPELQALLAEMRAHGVSAAAIEASSHALAQRRTWGLACTAAVFTNLTQDHLDYHGTMDAYLDAKLMLFDGRNGSVPGVAVVNDDDPAAPRVRAAAAGARELLYGVAPGCDVRITRVHAVPRGLELEFAFAGVPLPPLVLPMLGRYNAWNAAAAFGASIALGVDPDAALAALAAFAGVPGRLERVEAGQPFTVVVDYAHTPDALARALAACREHAHGRVLCVFGCGGDRDRGKRPLMGAIAAREADRAWVTNDNPRSEDPAAIAGEIVAGAPAGSLAVVLDRRAAIAAALEAAAAGDVVLIAGKGHETTQTTGSEVVPFDDREVARAALGARR